MNKVLKKVFFAFFLWSIIINGLSAFDFQINQAKVRMKLAPGWSDGGVIKVNNRDKDPIKIRVYLGDWVYSNQDGSKNFMPAGTHAKSCAEWIKFYPADFTVPGNGMQEVNYVVEVPLNAVGGYYAVLFFEIGLGDILDQEKGISVKVYNRLGSLFYVEAEGTNKREAQISDFKINSLGSDIEVEAVLENTGNVDITARGTYDIIDEEGFVLARANFDDVYTMPQDKAKLYVKSPNVNFSQAKYDVILTFDLEGEILVKEYSIDISGSGRVVNIKEIE